MWRVAKTVLLVVCAQALFAAEPPEWVSAELSDVAFRARLVRDVNEIQSRIGNDLDQEFILVELDVRPLYNSEVILKRDDFLLRSFRNNDRSHAQSPERIAGEAVLVLSDGGSGGGGVFAQPNETVVGGGLPGLGPAGYPTTGIGVGGGGGGSGDGLPTVTESRQQTGTLAGRLAEIELPIGPTREPVSGFLFFQVAPKHKIKHLVLNYDGSAGEIKISFKPK
jgi:hypothetical protein